MRLLKPAKTKGGKIFWIQTEFRRCLLDAFRAGRPVTRPSCVSLDQKCVNQDSLRVIWDSRGVFNTFFWLIAWSILCLLLNFCIEKMIHHVLYHWNRENEGEEIPTVDCTREKRSCEYAGRQIRNRRKSTRREHCDAKTQQQQRQGSNQERFQHRAFCRALLCVNIVVEERTFVAQTFIRLSPWRPLQKTSRRWCYRRSEMLHLQWITRLVTSGLHRLMSNRIRNCWKEAA